MACRLGRVNFFETDHLCTTETFSYREQGRCSKGLQGQVFRGQRAESLLGESNRT